MPYNVKSNEHRAEVELPTSEFSSDVHPAGSLSSSLEICMPVAQMHRPSKQKAETQTVQILGFVCLQKLQGLR